MIFFFITSVTIIHHTMSEHKNDHVTLNFTMIMSQFACTSCGPIGKIILFEVARTYQSYRASLILAYLDALGALLVCTLLPGALDSYRDSINALLFRLYLFLSFCS